MLDCTRGETCSLKLALSSKIVKTVLLSTKIIKILADNHIFKIILVNNIYFKKKVLRIIEH
jgi:hypothetical protein